MNRGEETALARPSALPRAFLQTDTFAVVTDTATAASKPWRITYPDSVQRTFGPSLLQAVPLLGQADHRLFAFRQYLNDIALIAAYVSHIPLGDPLAYADKARETCVDPSKGESEVLCRLTGATGFLLALQRASR